MNEFQPFLSKMMIFHTLNILYINTLKDDLFLSPPGIAWIGEIIAFPGEMLMRVHSTLSHGGLILFSLDTE